MEADLRGYSIRGGAISLASQSFKFLLTLASTMILARLLTPSDYGLIAMVSFVVVIAGRFRELGLLTATVQQAQVTHKQVSTLFWINLVLSAALMLTVMAAAPAVAWFYNEPRLTAITLVLSVMVLIDGVATQHEALLTRQMRFLPLAMTEVIAMTVGYSAAVYLAARGAGYWALVAQDMVWSLGFTIGAWVVCGWRPGLPARRSGARRMIRFGINLAGFRLLNYLAMNLDNVFIGKYIGAGPLGLYDKGYKLLMLPFRQVVQPLTGVAIPTLSRLQDDVARYLNYYGKGIHFSFALTMPAIAFVFVDADKVILTLLGDQWLGVVEIFRVLAPAAFLGKFNIITNWVYVSLGQTGRQLKWSAFALVVTVIGYAIGVRWGVMGVAAAHSIVTCALRYPSIVYCFKNTPLKVRDVLKVTWRPALASIVAGAALFGLGRIMPVIEYVAIALIVDFVLYALLYLGAWAAMPDGRRLMREFFDLRKDLRYVALQAEDAG